MHTLIVGNSNTGKTWLAKRIAADAAGDIVVYDPNRSTGWPPDARKYSDAKIFLRDTALFESAFIFVDEARTLWDIDTKAADQLVYRRRHQGLLLFLIAQRAKMVPPNARNQCSKIFAFRQQIEDAKILADEYHPDFLSVCDFRPGQFVFSDGFLAGNMSLNFSSLPPKIEKNTKTACAAVKNGL